MSFQTFKDLRSSSEHKLRYFWCIPKAIWPCIDSKDPNMIKAQKHSKDISKIVHGTSVVQPKFYKAMTILFVCKAKIMTIQKCVYSVSHYIAILECITYICNACMRIRCLVFTLFIGMCNNDRVLGRDSDDRSWKRWSWNVFFLFFIMIG